MTLNHWHSGHSLTHNFLRRIPQINSQCTRELYNKSREILDGLVKEENQKIEIQLLCRPDGGPMGSVRSFRELRFKFKGTEIHH